ADRGHREGARRRDARRAVELQRRHRHQCAADDLRGQRQAIHRDRNRAHPQLDGPRRYHAGTAQSRQERNDDFRVRAVTTINATREATMKWTSRKSMTPACALAALGCALLADSSPGPAADLTCE